MKDLGPLQHFLGIAASRSAAGMLLSQQPGQSLPAPALACPLRPNSTAPPWPAPAARFFRRRSPFSGRLQQLATPNPSLLPSSIKAGLSRFVSLFPELPFSFPHQELPQPPPCHLTAAAFPSPPHAPVSSLFLTFAPRLCSRRCPSHHSGCQAPPPLHRCLLPPIAQPRRTPPV
ncbi:hypothetical protein GUJ93_ZPchr0066g46489 [Zizania palustris]|uniref:Uncharacterized protein n=1 Tax=Zizania palustris TaxID=103762 RepID=A0A8J5QW35_ZIZPA|nr:hypothetical protein GUJ93_ZPchr0066g46489 [Zizania palustris]